MKLFTVVGVVNFIPLQAQSVLTKALGGNVNDRHDFFWLKYIQARSEVWEYVQVHWRELDPGSSSKSLSGEQKQQLTAENPGTAGELEIWLGIGVSR
jgi:hypothetical protein